MGKVLSTQHSDSVAWAVIPKGFPFEYGCDSGIRLYLTEPDAKRAANFHAGQHFDVIKMPLLVTELGDR